ncbi:MAG: NAD(P)H-dependent oxidoreductase [Verrucomicrobia bacterium]|nr:MAG: NAD(P)H-dependent oxidoreductase [Verrucomicrobiota bacterium]
MHAIAPPALTAALRWRYATKSFDPAKKIPQDVFDGLLDALVLTPSSFGIQPWKFIVVQDPALRAELQPASWNQPQVTEASHFIVLAAREAIATAQVDAWIAHIAKARGVSEDSLAEYRGRMAGFLAAMDDEQKFAWASRQTYIALGQLMTSAALLGVDSCPLEGISPPAYDAALGLAGSGYRTVVACALGYRSAGDKYALVPKSRFDHTQVVEYR